MTLHCKFPFFVKSCFLIFINQRPNRILSFCTRVISCMYRTYQICKHLQNDIIAGTNETSSHSIYAFLKNTHRFKKEVEKTNLVNSFSKLFCIFGIRFAIQTDLLLTFFYCLFFFFYCMQTTLLLILPG